MKPHMAVAGLALAMALVWAPPVLAQDAASQAPPAADAATREDVKRETDEAVEAVMSYSTARRQAAQDRARTALDRMGARLERLQDDLARERAQSGEQARDTGAWMMAGARERLALASQSMRELEAAGEAEWPGARERFVDSYRSLADAVEGLVERAMPGRPVPPEARSTDDDAADEAEEMRPEDEPHPDDHRDDAPRGASPGAIPMGAPQ